MELKITANSILPGNEMTWDKGLNFEGQMIFWLNKHVGVAPTVGVGHWNANTRGVLIWESPRNPGIYALAGGDVTVVPMGVSLVVKPILPKGIGLILEGGFRYVWVGDNIHAVAIQSDGWNSTMIRSRVDIGAGYIGTVSTEFSWPIRSGTNLYVGAGYQFDISKGRSIWRSEDFGDNELKGFLVKAGIGFSL